MPEIYDTITSASNPLVKTFRSLERKKGRSETGLFIAEGVKLINQGLTNGWDVDSLIIAATALDRDYVADLAKSVAAQGARVVTVPGHLMERITKKDNPQAAIASFRQKTRRLDDLPSEDTLRFVGLYEVRDPGNLGTVIRTADCAGVDGVILVGQCCDPYSVEAVRASMGSIFDMVPIVTNTASLVDWCRASSVSVSAASINGTIAHSDVQFAERSLVLMGNEQAGLPIEIEAQCDRLVRIPMRGGADSLNLAQATAIMIYEVWRQQGYA